MILKLIVLSKTTNPFSKIVYFLSQADPGLAAKCLFELINEKPVKIAIFGPPKSNPYEIVGQITPKFYLTQVSYRFSTM